MARYYDICEKSWTPIPSAAYVDVNVDAFIDACHLRYGPAVADQAHALLVRGQACEDQNPNALNRIRGLAMERAHWPLAIALGDFFDHLAY